MTIAGAAGANDQRRHQVGHQRVPRLASTASTATRLVGEQPPTGSDFDGFDRRADLRRHLRRPDLKDKLFFFVNYEKYEQRLVTGPGPRHRPRSARRRHRRHHAGRRSTASSRRARHRASTPARSTADAGHRDRGVRASSSTGTSTTTTAPASATARPSRTRRASCRASTPAPVAGARTGTTTTRRRRATSPSCSATGPTPSRPKLKVSYRDYSRPRPVIALADQPSCIGAPAPANSGAASSSAPSATRTPTSSNARPGTRSSPVTWSSATTTVKFGVDYERNDIYNLFLQDA